MIQLNLTKEQSLINLDLRKQEVNDIVMGIPELQNITSRVALVLDFSGSMRSLYQNGTVQSVIERIMPIAMQFDDNQALDLWIFDNKFIRIGEVVRDNFYGLTDQIMQRYSMGGTSYAPVMKDVYKKYIKEDPNNLPNYVIFITDGDNSDHQETDKVITELSNHPIFFQFIGIGHDKFNYLNKLDVMEGRYVDNANFFSIANINEISDRELYTQLFAEFPEWLKDEKVQNMIAKQTNKGFFKFFN
jgi:hypothetical protein